MRKNEIIKELDYLYEMERKFVELLNELSQVIINKKNDSFVDVYNNTIIRYFNIRRQDENPETGIH